MAISLQRFFAYILILTGLAFVFIPSFEIFSAVDLGVGFILAYRRHQKNKRKSNQEKQPRKVRNRFMIKTRTINVEIKTRSTKKSLILIKRKTMNNNHQYKTEEFNDLVNNYIMNEEWDKAKDILEKELEKSTEDHWIITQLSEVFYEMRNYDKALELSTKAIELAPDCPLVMNDNALHLYMHEKDKEAIEIWEKMLKKRIEEIAYGTCGEGLRTAKSMLNDVRMRIALSYYETGQKEKALSYIKEHLNNRQRGLYSNFTKREVERKIEEVELSLNDKKVVPL